MVAVVVVVASLVGWRVVESRRHGAALDSCNRAVKTLQDKTDPSRMASYREASYVKTEQVKDAKTVQVMARDVKAVGELKQPTLQCKASMMSTGELKTVASKADKLANEYAAVSKSAKSVLASREAKSLEDAKTALNAKKDEASSLFGDSDGKVADNATRDGLQRAIDQGGQVKGDKAKKYKDAANVLQAAIDQVNASMQARARQTSRPPPR